jgi:hypothetical protein
MMNVMLLMGGPKYGEAMNDGTPINGGADGMEEFLLQRMKEEQRGQRGKVVMVVVVVF